MYRSNPFDFTVPEEATRRSIFEAIFKELDESLRTGGVLRGASYWMFDPSLQNANSEGFEGKLLVLLTHC